jgi:hypothetical protein
MHRNVRGNPFWGLALSSARRALTRFGVSEGTQRGRMVWMPKSARLQTFTEQANI